MPLKGIIAVHGGGRDRRELHRFLPWLHGAGYEVLTYDCREHGLRWALRVDDASAAADCRGLQLSTLLRTLDGAAHRPSSDGTGRGFDWGRVMYRDVLGAAIYARDVLGWSRVACVGVSNGAAILLLASAMDDGRTYGQGGAAPARAEPHPDLRGVFRRDGGWSIGRAAVCRSLPRGRPLLDVLVAESPYRSPASGMLDILTAFLMLLPPWLKYFTLLQWLAPFIVRLAVWQIERQGPEKLVAVEAVIDRVAPRPVFFIHGTLDNRFRPAHSVALYERLKSPTKGASARPHTRSRRGRRGARGFTEGGRAREGGGEGGRRRSPLRAVDRSRGPAHRSL